MSSVFAPQKADLLFVWYCTVAKKELLARLFDALGYDIKVLDRVIYAGVPLKGLARGQWRYLTKAEVQHLQNMVRETKSPRAKVAKRSVPAIKKS